jgi:hypothetical protein
VWRSSSNSLVVYVTVAAIGRDEHRIGGGEQVLIIHAAEHGFRERDDPLVAQRVAEPLGLGRVLAATPEQEAVLRIEDVQDRGGPRRVRVGRGPRRFARGEQDVVAVAEPEPRTEGRVTPTADLAELDARPDEVASFQRHAALDVHTAERRGRAHDLDVPVVHHRAGPAHVGAAGFGRGAVDDRLARRHGRRRQRAGAPRVDEVEPRLAPQREHGRRAVAVVAAPEATGLDRESRPQRPREARGSALRLEVGIGVNEVQHANHAGGRVAETGGVATARARTESDVIPTHSGGISA